MISNCTSTESFLSVAVGEDRSPESDYASESAWTFGRFGRTSDFMNEGNSPRNNRWEVHVTTNEESQPPAPVDFALGISVLFPVNRLAVVTERWRTAVTAAART